VNAANVNRGPIADIATGADASRIIVTNYADDSVSVLDADTLEVLTTAVASEPFAAIVYDDHAFVSTSTASHAGVCVIDTKSNSVIATYPLAFDVTALAISPDAKRVYAARTGRDHVDVAVIDTTAERVGTIDIATGAGLGIGAIDIDSSGRRLYAGINDAHGGQLTVVNTETAIVERTAWVGAPIRDLALGNDTVYVLTSDGAVSVIDLSTDHITDTVEVGGAPTQMTLTTDTTCAYIVDHDRVAVLCTQSLEIVDSIAVDVRPSCVAVSCDGRRLYVADYVGMVSVFAVA
jgi:YVTN family beta-propeller protein